jgi:hypothetical protein
LNCLQNSDVCFKSNVTFASNQTLHFPQIKHGIRLSSNITPASSGSGGDAMEQDDELAAAIAGKA